MKMTITSIIVPMYNEEKRALAFLKELIDFKNKHSGYEIVFVNDGSTDRTLDMVKKLAEKEKNIKIISYKKNRGKGAAIKQGVFNSNGSKILFIDADGSISPDQIPKLAKGLDSYDVVIGTRYSKRANVEQPFYRLFIGTTFNLYVNLLFNLKIYDTLCGFKGFKREIAKDLFGNLVSKKWSFDVDILYRIKKKKYSLYQLPIKWVHKRGTKVKLFDPLKIAFELLMLRMKI